MPTALAQVCGRRGGPARTAAPIATDPETVLTVDQNAFVKGRLIAHAGGAVDGRKYSNSVEALEGSRELVSLIEFDICDSADGLIVAHDGLEKHYGLDRPFNAVTTEEFRRTRYEETLSPMSLRDLVSRLTEADASAILDIKAAEIDDYRRALEQICALADEYGVRDKLVPQIYSPEDFAAVREFGLDSFILALWKKYYDVRSAPCRDCIERCFDGPADGFRALSMASWYFWKDGEWVGEDLVEYSFARSPMLFLHGQVEWAEKPLLERGFGLFTHYPAKLLPFL